MPRETLYNATIENDHASGTYLGVVLIKENDQLIILWRVSDHELYGPDAVLVEKWLTTSSSLSSMRRNEAIERAVDYVRETRAKIAERKQS